MNTCGPSVGCQTLSRIVVGGPTYAVEQVDGGEWLMFDQRVEAAWRDFHERLVAAIERFGEGEIFRISLDRTSVYEAGDAPFVELNVVLPQVLVEVASNMTLARTWRMSRTQQARVRRLGMVCPTRQEPTYGKYYDITRPDEAAAAVVTALREGFGVVDPALLTSPRPVLTPPTREPWETSPLLADGARPTSRAEVNALVAIALRPLVGEVDTTDDGDAIVHFSGTSILVRPSRRAPRIRMCCTLPHHERDLDEATRIAQRLNGCMHALKFVVLDDEDFLVMADMLASPFVPEHLREHLEHLFRIIDGWDDEFLPEARDRQETP